MRIVDYISKTIQEFPVLYKDLNYEKSKIKVLDSIFFSGNSGLEIAKTKNPKDGGYMVIPKYKKDKKTDEWIRIKDNPYGKEKYKPIPKEYFKTVVWYIIPNKNHLETIYRKKKIYDDILYLRYNKEYIPELYIAENTHEFSPTPFSKDISPIYDIYYNNIFLQDDWLKELIFLCKKTIEYFNDEKRYKNHIYYGKYGKTEFEKNKNWEFFYKEQVNFLQKFLEKYK